MCNKDLFDHIPLLRPWLGEEEAAAAKEVIESGWVSQGFKVQEFENMVAAFVGAEYAVATNACTSAIHLGLRNQGVKLGDEVLLANTTCMANVNAIKMAGAEPVFVDIQPRTHNIDPELIEESITEKTKAILTIDQIGLASDLDRIKGIASKHDLIIVDDAATALGGKYKEKHLGSHGLVTTFSFHPRKMITTGEGGMLVTDNEDIAAKARTLRATGASVSDLDRHKAKGTVLQKYYDCGYNYRMTDIQAAIGVVQMKKLPSIIEQRASQAEYYNDHFSDMDELIVPFVPKYATHVYSSYLLELKSTVRITTKEIINEMAERNISCRYGIPPLHREPYFANERYSDHTFPVSCDVEKRTFFIPIYPGLTQEGQDHIIGSIRDILAKEHQHYVPVG